MLLASLPMYLITLVVLELYLFCVSVGTKTGSKLAVKLLLPFASPSTTHAFIPQNAGRT